MATRKKLGEVLVEAGLIDSLQLEAALSHQRSWGGHLGRILIDSRFLTEQQLVETLSQHLGVPHVELARREAHAALLVEVPLELAERFNVVPVALRSEQKGEVLYLAMSDPTNLDAVDTIQFKTGKRVSPMIASESDIEGAIRRFYYGERPREITTTSLQHVQFVGRDIAPSGADEDIPVVTGATLLDAPAEPSAPTDPQNDPDWFLQLDAPPPAPAPTPSFPALMTPPPSGASAPAPAASPFDALSSPFGPPPSSPALATVPPSSPGFEAVPPATDSLAAPAVTAPYSSTIEADGPGDAGLFGSPNSFLGRDDDTGLGQRDARPPRPNESAPPPRGEALGEDSRAATSDVAFGAPSDDLSSTSTPGFPSPFIATPALRESGDGNGDAEPLDLGEVGEPLSLDEEDDTPIELAIAADFLHGGPPLGYGSDHGLEISDDDEPMELTSAVEVLEPVREDQEVTDPAFQITEDGEAPLLFSTAAELAALELQTASDDAPALDDTSSAGDAPFDDGALFDDLSELRELALARLEEIDTEASESERHALEPAASTDVATGLEPVSEEAPAQSLRPLPPPGGVVPSDPDDVEDAPIEVVNMPPDRKPVTFVPVAEPQQAAASVEDDFGNPLDPSAAESAELEALEIEGSVFDSDSGEVTPGAPMEADAFPDIEVAVEAGPKAGAPEEQPVALAADPEPVPAEETADAPPLTAHDISELEHRHDGTTSHTAAGLADTAEHVAGNEAGHGEVMRLNLPTPAFSEASIADAPWHLEGAPAPAGRGQTDVPLAPLGVASSAFAVADDVNTLAPPTLVAAAAANAAQDAADAGGIPLPSPSPPEDDGFVIPDTVPASALGPASDEDHLAEHADVPAPFADQWREAAERQLLERAVSDAFEVPERRRRFVPTAPAVVDEAPAPTHPYQPSGPLGATVPSRPPWAVLVDAAARASESEARSDDDRDVEVDVDAGVEGVPEPAVEDSAIAAAPMPPEEVPSAAEAEAEAEAVPVAVRPVAQETGTSARVASSLPERGHGSSGVALPSATPRSVLIAAAVQMDDDLTPESSPPAPSPSALAGAASGAGFMPTPTMISRMSPDELRALAERLLQRGALTADDVDAARKARRHEAADDDG